MLSEVKDARIVVKATKFGKMIDRKFFVILIAAMDGKTLDQ